jgi:hypothetical protein
MQNKFASYPLSLISYNFDLVLLGKISNIFKEITRRITIIDKNDDIIFLGVVQNDTQLRGVEAFKNDI